MGRDDIFVSVVIVAAGSSTRMGRNKMLLELGTMTVFERTAAIFEECNTVDEIVVVSSKENINRYIDLVRKNLYTKVTHVIVGGSNRQESVRMGLEACNKNAHIILIHDGARPLVKPESIYEVAKAAMEYGAAAAAVKSRDTIKHIDEEGFADSTVDRETSVLIQTPQGFRRELILSAHKKAMEDGFIGTDDCSLIEHMGGRTKLIYLNYFNIKLTVPEDVLLAKAVLTVRGKL